MYRLEHRILDSLDAALSLFCVVYHGKKLVGMVNSALLPYPYEAREYNQAFFPWERIYNPKGETLLLFCSAVDPKFRNKGIWKLMLDYRINYAKTHKEIKRVWTVGRAEENEYGPNTAALLERFGFKSCEF